MNKPIDNIDELISDTLLDMHLQAGDYIAPNPAKPLNRDSANAGIVKLVTNKRSKYSMMTVAASFALIAMVSVLALLSWQGSISNNRDLNTTKSRVETTTTLDADEPATTTQTTEAVGPVTTESPSRPGSTVPPVTIPPSNTSVNPPSDFEAYDHYKNAFGWYVKLRWSASTTAGVSYCYSIDRNEIESGCQYDGDFTGNSGDFSVGIGNVGETTFYLRTVRSDGVKSEIATAKYTMP